MREAQTRNLEIPGSLAVLAPRNDGEAVLLEMGLRQVKYNAW
jgi:hypothetical protein